MDEISSINPGAAISAAMSAKEQAASASVEVAILDKLLKTQSQTMTQFLKAIGIGNNIDALA